VWIQCHCLSFGPKVNAFFEFDLYWHIIEEVHCNQLHLCQRDSEMSLQLIWLYQDLFKEECEWNREKYNLQQKQQENWWMNEWMNEWMKTKMSEC
jgi:hypothetical protein